MAGFTVKLAKPIKSTKGDIAALEFREPIGFDVFELGMPFRTIIGGDIGSGTADGKTIEMSMDPAVFKQWCQRLSSQGIEDIGAAPAYALRAVFNWLTEELNRDDGSGAGTEKN